MKLVHLYWVCMLIFLACNRPRYECMNPPPSISFRLTDKNTSADLLVNGTITQSQITIKDEMGKIFQFEVRGNDSLKLVNVLLGRNTGSHNYTLSAPEASILFTVDIVDTDCGDVIRSRQITTPALFDKRGFYVISL